MNCFKRNKLFNIKSYTVDTESMSCIDAYEDIKYVKNQTYIKKIKREFLGITKILFVAVFIAFIVNNFIVLNAVIPTPSMSNTINPNDKLIVSRFSYLFDDPEYGDIIVFKYPDDREVLFVKRIIGLPGDVINIIDGEVFIGSSIIPLVENYLPEKMEGSFGPYVVPENSYFVMGDNRNDSKDSRYWINKFVFKDDIIGKPVFTYSPDFELLN